MLINIISLDQQVLRTVHSTKFPHSKVVYKFCCYIGVTRSRKIKSDGDYQKNKERAQELKILWKKEKLLHTINKYNETFDTNTITSFSVQIVTFKVLTQIPFLCG